MNKNMKKSQGLTMLELMITLTVAGILIAGSVPSFRESIQNTRLVTQVNELQTALSLARSEAVKRNETVTVCSSDNGSTCTENWQDGWIVFVDIDSDGVVDSDNDETLCEAAEDCVLRVRDDLAGDNTLSFSLARVTYAPNGIADTGANGVFTLCDSRGDNKAKGLVIGLSGRPRLAVSGDDLECPS